MRPGRPTDALTDRLALGQTDVKGDSYSARAVKVSRHTQRLTDEDVQLVHTAATYTLQTDKPKTDRHTDRQKIGHIQTDRQTQAAIRATPD